MTMQIIDLVPDLQPVILAARQVRDARNTLAQFLPNTPVASIRYKLGRGRRLDQTVPVRAIDAPATPIRQPGVLTVEGELPSITPILNLSEQDLQNEMTLARELAGLPVDFMPSVASGAAHAALTVDNTLETMRGQLLSTGVVSLTADDGTVHVVDFEVPAGQKFTPAIKWTDATGAPTGDPFADLIAWHKAFINASGDRARVLLASDDVYLHLVNRLRLKFPQQPLGESALNGYLADQRLPQIVTYDRTLTGYDGTKTRVYPAGTLTFLPGPDAPVGRTELGITQHARLQVQRQILTADQAPGLTIVTLGSDNPPQRAVMASAMGLPILSDNESIVIASGVFS
jgi:hypothetical protein